MNNITVNNITNLISYDFKHANTDFDYENSVFNINKERQLKDITTDTFINDMFSDRRPEDNNTDEVIDNKVRENNRFNFLGYVYTYLNLKLKLELPLLLIEHSIILKPGEDVYLLFKGGNMMYYKYEELKQHIKPVLQHEFFKLFDSNFKISDFDFTCYITVKDRERFYKVKKIVNQILWEETVKIRNFFENYINVALDNAVNPELQRQQIPRDNKVFYAINTIEFNNSQANKQTRIKNIKDILFSGVNITAPQTSFDTILNKGMQINEEVNDKTTLDLQQVQSTLYHLRNYLYRELIYHKTPEKLSQKFDDQYKQKNETLKSLIVLMWKKISNYVDSLGVNDQNNYMNIVEGNHIQTLLQVHEFLTLIKMYRTSIFDANNPINEIVLIQQTNHLYRFLQKFVQDFALIYEHKIVENDLYNIFTISQLLNNIKTNLNNKKDTLTVCETIYDEYQAFDGDTKELKNIDNYNFIVLQGKELDVYIQKREDFYIQPSLLGNSTTYTDTSSSSFHYVYQNSTIKKMRNQSSSVVDFDLLRVKFSVNLSISGVKKHVKIPSEFIDISICNYDDSALTEFRNHTEDGLGLFTIKNNNLSLECYGYSIDFMVHDLIYVLYEQNLFTPWADAKYNKRIQRLNALQMLSYVGDFASMQLYLLSVLVVFIIVTYSEVYVDGKGKIDANNDMDRLFTNARDNVVMNFKKYNLERVFNILPTSMLDVIYQTYLPEYKKFMIPYPDQIIGSVILYSILQQYYYEETNNDDNQKRIKDIINRYRNDFLFLPADDDDIKKTIDESKLYVKQMSETFSQMLDLVKVQSQAGGEKEVITKKTTKQYTFF
jgi:hypothetical protein